MERTLAAGLPCFLSLPRLVAARFLLVAGFLGLTALPCFLNLTALPCLTGVLGLALFLCLVVRTGRRCVPRSVAALTGHLRLPPLHLSPAHRFITNKRHHQLYCSTPHSNLCKCNWWLHYRVGRCTR